MGCGWMGQATHRSSSDPQWTGVEWGQNLWAISLLIQGFSSLVGSINYITTIINMRAPGMTFFRMPLVVWSLFIVAILLLLAFPVLSSALGLLIFDRLAGTTFFTATAEGGGGPAALAASLLVLRTSRGLYPYSTRNGYRF